MTQNGAGIGVGVFTLLSGIVLIMPLQATTIYKCKTAKGITFSQRPCAENAEKLQLKIKKARRSEASDSGEYMQYVPIEKFENLKAYSTEEVIEAVGRPAASYLHDGTERWLYPNARRITDDKAYCPELLFENNVRFQINWLPEQVMRKSVPIAKRIANWRQPAETKLKQFVLADTAVQGQSRSSVMSRLGAPDAKRVFNGQEIWEYEKVRTYGNDKNTLTLFLTFEGDTVVQSAGN